jgi:HEPN domain-containing protein
MVDAARPAQDVFKKQAEEWFVRGHHDIETAQLLYEQNGYVDSIVYHIQQAIEKYLKGYLVLHRKKPPKIHELDTLLNHISTFDKSFDSFIDLCEKASRYYIEDRYPPGPPVEYRFEEVKNDLDRAWELINQIQAKVR